MEGITGGKMKEFPIRFTDSLGHYGRDAFADWEVDEEGNQLYSDAFHRNFHYALYEILIDLEVYEDGSYKILEIRDGDQVLRPID